MPLRSAPGDRLPGRAAAARTEPTSFWLGWARRRLCFQPILILHLLLEAPTDSGLGFSKPFHPDQFMGCHPKSEFMARQLTALLMDVGTMGLIQTYYVISPHSS